MRRLLLFLLLVTRLAAAGAQEEFVEPSRFLTRVPFHQYTGGVIVFSARVGNSPDTLNFLLDSGSGGISLDSMTAEALGLKPLPSDRSIRGIAGTRKVSFVNNLSLHLPGLSADSLNFHINDYSLLTAVYGERIDGIVGYSLLSRYILKINYDSTYIDFWSKGSLKYPRGGFLLRPQISTLPVHPFRVRDEKAYNARFLYDLGAGLNMMFTTDFVRDSVFLKKKRKLFAKQAEGLGGKIDMHMTVIREVRVGPYRFREVPVYVFNDLYNVTSYPTLAGLIGSDLLRRFNAIVNYDRGEIYLLPNSHFRDQFDYSYPGLELYLIDDLITVGDVAKGSPAEKAGLLEGDIVVSINKDFSQLLGRYKLLLQQTHERVEVMVRRGTELKQFSFIVGSIQ
ncbi:aspartyl protease family protein [Flaviaesturariibacter amylovorans]|uniref:PDZ domain-containing protein n=1 Tax=Flaviaesturariibacter amylovorans TaxID=1084520 RepID=A0ABP8HE03_9BACT